MTDRSPPEIILSSGNNYAMILPEQGGTLARLGFEDASGQVKEQLWSRHARPAPAGQWPDGGLPILFPFAGRVWQQGQVGQYQHQETTFPMPIHGFLYSQSGAILEQTSNKVKLEFIDHAATHRHYPWHFRVIVAYEINGTSLTLTVTVSNLGCLLPNDNSSMPVAVGFHPYFILADTLKVSADHLQLRTQAECAYRVTAQGDLGEQFCRDPFDEIQVSQPAFQNTIIRRSSQVPIQVIGGQIGSRTVLRTVGPLNYLVLWGQPEESFFCIEPWMAPPNAPNLAEDTAHLTLNETLEVGISISQEL